MKSSLLIKITALLMVAVTMFTLASCSLFGDDSSEETTTTELSMPVTLSAKPENTAEIVDFFNSAVNNIKAQKPAVSVTRKADVRDIDTGDNGDAKALIKFAKSFAEKLEKTSDSREWGSDLNDFLPIAGTSVVSKLTPADVAEASINTRGATEENPEPLDDNRFYYSVNILLNDSDKAGAVANAFDLTVDKETVLAEFQDYTDTLEVSDYDVSYNGCSIYAEINKETNEVVYLSYTLNAIVSTTVDFLGELESLGETDVTFNYQQTAEYSGFVWEQPTEASSVAE